METSGIVPAVLGGMSIAAVVLLGVWRMLAHYERRNDKAHGELRDAITSAETRLGQRIDRLDERFENRFDGLDGRLRNVEQGFARIDQRLATLERVVLPPASPAQ